MKIASKVTQRKLCCGLLISKFFVEQESIVMTLKSDVTFPLLVSCQFLPFSPSDKRCSNELDCLGTIDWKILFKTFSVLLSCEFIRFCLYRTCKSLYAPLCIMNCIKWYYSKVLSYMYRTRDIVVKESANYNYPLAWTGNPQRSVLNYSCQVPVRARSKPVDRTQHGVGSRARSKPVDRTQRVVGSNCFSLVFENEIFFPETKFLLEVVA